MPTAEHQRQETLQPVAAQQGVLYTTIQVVATHCMNVCTLVHAMQSKTAESIEQQLSVAWSLTKLNVTTTWEPVLLAISQA